VLGVENPADDPNVTARGGYSQIFSKPLYQYLVNTGSATHRAVPEVSLMMGGCPGDADLAVLDCTAVRRSAVIMWFAGVPNLVIGTSSMPGG
jgi:kumamolisin